MSKSIKEIRLHGSSIDLHDPVKNEEESYPQTEIHSIPSHEDEGHKGEKNNMPDKKNKCASLLDKYTSLRCLAIWMALITLLFVAASVVYGIFLICYIQNDLKDQTDDMSNLEKTVSSLQRQLTDQQQINQDDHRNISELKKTVKSQQITISQLQQKISRLEKKPDTHVFFTAIPSKSFITVQDGQTVVYDHVITSKGGGYDVSTGIFRAQKSGYYRADVHALAEQGTLVHLGLAHNGVQVLGVYCTKDGGDGNSCSNSAIVLLNQGDSLNVASHGTSYFGSGLYNSFSAQLLSVV